MNAIKHIAIIMDGNGRWGLKKKKSRKYGHTKGIQVVESVLKLTIDHHIPYLTLFTFSTENWKRPKNEINFLFELMRKFFKKNLSKIVKQNIKVSVIGKKNKLPRYIRQIILRVEKATRNNDKIHLVLAINYGAKEEIVDACNKILSTNAKNVSCSTFQKALYTSSIPDPDVLIRTGGKQRLSNFLLWQLAYTEIFFVKEMWPEFRNEQYIKILKKFKKIKRNFGGI